MCVVILHGFLNNRSYQHARRNIMWGSFAKPPTVLILFANPRKIVAANKIIYCISKQLYMKKKIPSQKDFTRQNAKINALKNVMLYCNLTKRNVVLTFGLICINKVLIEVHK